MVLALFTSGEALQAQYPSTSVIRKDGAAIAVEDFASIPPSNFNSNSPVNPPYNTFQLGRMNFLRSEPAAAPLASTRFFVNDMNRFLYIIDKTTKSVTVYINFQSIFPKFDPKSGYAAGLSSFSFDPNYASNGRFYTVHVEDPSLGGSAMPTNGALPGLSLAGYALTTSLDPPAGAVSRQNVMIEWTDTNVNNATFEGTAREVLRMGFNTVDHPIGELLFNPLAFPGDSDYGNLYFSAGDAADGEVAGALHTMPQRLDTLQGKILRITPDLTLRPADLLSDNGRYRIPNTGPDPNPFVSLSLAGVRKDIFAYGFRNCHRLSWDPVSNTLIENDIGLHSWEEVNIVVKGGNYGYGEREGTEQLFVGGSNDGKTGSQTSPVTPFPASDQLTVNGLVNPVTPIYPVAQYSHREGDGIANGFVYRGALMPQMQGKYIFGDITTGRLFYCNFADMLASNDGIRTNVAPIHELQVVYHGVERRFFDLVHDAYFSRGGIAPGRALPGGAVATNGNDPYGVPYGIGRADIRLALGGDGEIYILSKSDGMIRKLVAALTPPLINSVILTNSVLTLTWPSISNHVYRVQFRTNIVTTNWSNLAGDVTATGPTAFQTDSATNATRFYRILMVQ
jgi:hypothetical protein